MLIVDIWSVAWLWPLDSELGRVVVFFFLQKSFLWIKKISHACSFTDFILKFECSLRSLCKLEIWHLCSLEPKTRIDESESLTLDGIRQSLIRQEDSIIFSLLERSQFCYNAETYNPDALPLHGFQGSLIEYMLKETEKLHAQVL